MVQKGFNELAAKAPDVAAQWHPTLNGNLTPEMVTPGSHRRVWWQCPLGHTWKAFVYSRTGAQRCGCAGTAGKSCTADKICPAARRALYRYFKHKTYGGKSMKKRILSLLLILCMAVTLLPTAVFAEDATGKLIPAGGAKIGETVYQTLEAAVTAAASGDTIVLGEGNYTLYNVSSEGHTKGKDLTFEGQGTDKTNWYIGANPTPEGFNGEYDGDYCFDGAKTITFRNLTLRAGSKDYLGFIRADNTVVEDCIINGKTFYWGYTSAEFTNTTFNCPSGDYAIWTYSSPTMTFDTCTFNSSGKVINVYTDYGAGKQDITVNFKNCTVNNTGKSLKPVLNINDSNMGKFKYILNISGNTTVTGVDADKDTCSRLFGFGGKAASNNKGKTVVNFGDTTVWEDGKMVDAKAYHNEGVTVDGVTYDNGVAGANDSLYAEGYKDNAFTITYSEWTKNPDGTKTHTVTKTCNYCGYQESTTETAEADPIDWDVSKSKIATKLDTNTWTSNVTLSLPSAEEALGSDIVFVIDKSQCGAEASDAATELVGALLAQQELENAKLKVGIIAFGGTAKVIRPLSEVTSADDLNDSVAKTAAAGLHGSNIQSGLIEADKMLSADTEVSDSRKYVILVSDGHTYEFSKEGEYDKYVDGATEFTGLKTYGIYNETDLYAYAYGISYTIHCLHDQYYTGDYNSDGTRKNGWSGSYLTDAVYKTGTFGGSNEIRNVYELPYGTWNAYLEHITEVVKADNGMYDVELHYTTSGYIDYDNQCIKDDNDLKTNPKAETKRQKADRILGENNYIKCGLDENGKDNQLMHASGVDRAVYEAYSKYASMAEKYHCYPIYVKKDYYDSAQTTQDYGYQLMCALGKISNNTGLDVSTPNAPATVPAISNIFSSIKMAFSTPLVPVPQWRTR